MKAEEQEGYTEIMLSCKEVLSWKRKHTPNQVVSKRMVHEVPFGGNTSTRHFRSSSSNGKTLPAYRCWLSATVLLERARKESV
ncbi:hypothetical protein PIB30_045712 [Stylosanthes scabra]|uniref:Uncharacterized protein n=1 Tax=Stylosanthes scabra TaxID=79078 RepID=A0ABU6VIE3_9FABA|nr:hypothetical protein [Stylosanthes scabra]